MSDDLAIPDFLRRAPGAPAKKIKTRRWTRLAKPLPPEGERWLKAVRYQVHLHDELPKLGCGQRLVWVVEGRRWARISDGGAICKVPMATWAVVLRTAKEMK